MYRHILIATDGSVLGDHAVAQGLSLAKSIGAKVTALVVEVPLGVQEVSHAEMGLMSQAISSHGELMRKHAEQVLQSVTDAAKTTGVACATVEIEDPHPSEAIVTTAEDRGCDLIVMASHGRGGVSAALLGSVTSKVLSHTSLPVLVCH